MMKWRVAIAWLFAYGSVSMYTADDDDDDDDADADGDGDGDGDDDVRLVLLNLRVVSHSPPLGKMI